MEERTLPIRGSSGSRDVALNRADHGGNHGWLKAGDGAGERTLIGMANGPPLFCRKVIDGLRTEVDQIAARGLEQREKITLVNGWIHAMERFEHRAIKARVSLIEEPARSRRSLSDEEQPNTVRAMPPSQALTLQVHLK